MTYLVSEVDVDATTWVSRDRGFDPNTNEQCWGSEHGPLRFKRVSFLGDSLKEDWLRW
jgi:CpeT protein